MIAVFDIGKTNKKCFIFNEDYHIVFEKTNQLTETIDEDGEVCENLDLLKNWILATVRETLHDPRFQIRAINVTTYGASLVHLDEDGQILTPLYNYLRPFPDDLKKQFFEHYGGESKITLETASPVLGNLNAGLQLYWLKYYKPLVFKQIKWSLHFPQFIAYFIYKNLVNNTKSDGLHFDQERSLSFRTEGQESEAEGRSKYIKSFGLRPPIPRYAANEPGGSGSPTSSGTTTFYDQVHCRMITDVDGLSLLHDSAIKASEITSIGCHTMLWDFQKNDYHDWTKAEGIAEKFPPIQPSNLALPITDNHYTNNHYTDNHYTNNQYTDNQAQSIQTGTGLHDSSAALIPYLAHFKEPFILISTGTWCISLNPFNAEPLTAEELRQDCLCYLSYAGKAVKAARYFGGQEHEQGVRELAARYGVGEDFYRMIDLADGSELSDSYQHLVKQLVEKQANSTRLALGNTAIRHIFVDGGFAKNELYLTLLAEAFPEMEVFSAEVPQATALGAALAIHACWNPKPLPLHLIPLKKY